MFTVVGLIQKNKSPLTNLNGPIHIECKILKHVVDSAAKAETVGLFYNYQVAVHIRNMLTALNHPQTAIPSKIDSSTICGFVNDILKKKRSKAWDVRYHWSSDQSTLDHILFIRIKGATIKLIITQNIMFLFIIVITGTYMC